MKIDFIKWMVGYADGFEIESFPSREPYFKYTNILWSLITAEKSYLYPLLLQKAIEGINKKYYIEGSKIYPWCILTISTHYRICNLRDDIEEYFDIDYDYIDQTKEQTLKYIYEQEVGK